MKDKDQTTASGFAPQKPSRLTPADVQQKEFRVSFRGYNERDVDEFLDRVTEELQRYEAEVMRERSERVSFDPATLDVDEASRQILREAQERADAIVREAEARAAGIPTASATEARTVVAPYLNREREFLQSLGTLVQAHANTIKTMVEEARRRTETPVHASAPAAPERATPAPDRAVPVTPAAPTDTTQDVVVLGDDPAPAEAERSEPEREPEGARSLRELFWGQD
jgi:cell division initiation protein